MAGGAAMVLLCAGGCGPGAGRVAEDRADTEARAPATAPASPQVEWPVIGESGIGYARRGMTLRALRDSLPPAIRLGDLDERFMVDISALPVIAGSDTLYHLLFSSLEAVNDSLHLEMVATLNPGARTTDGLGPGTTLADFAARHGPLTLAYSVNDESREYVHFGSQPGNMYFRVRPPADDRAFAGVYATSSEYNTTTRYAPDARILMVIVDLRQ